ncbi:MAG: hypothetical protein CL565_02540 [Alphaproteobacteria bacterium]|nr:hypothetical protein [Alphaproteobacteria bacterium]|tara:strand:+ start:719 stop:1102 length:384 start_codon:yes stop_codon:yes gene_type:complete
MKKNFLIIEDDLVDTKIMEKFLNDVFPENNIYISDSISTAFGIYKKTKIDIILLDLNLPESIGVGSIKLVKEFSRNTPVIVMTGYLNTNISRKLQENGAQAVISKDKMDDVFTKKLIEKALDIKFSE